MTELWLNFAQEHGGKGKEAGTLSHTHVRRLVTIMAPEHREVQVLHGGCTLLWREWRRYRTIALPPPCNEEQASPKAGSSAQSFPELLLGLCSSALPHSGLCLKGTFRISICKRINLNNEQSRHISIYFVYHSQSRNVVAVSTQRLNKI